MLPRTKLRPRQVKPQAPDPLVSHKKQVQCCSMNVMLQAGAQCLDTAPKASCRCLGHVCEMSEEVQSKKVSQGSRTTTAQRFPRENISAPGGNLLRYTGPQIELSDKQKDVLETCWGGWREGEESH